MEKIKNIFSPGHNKDDELMYGTPQSSGQASEPSKLETDPEAEKSSNPIGRQILNPGGEKYSEQSHGTTAVAAEDTQKPTATETEPREATSSYGTTAVPAETNPTSAAREIDPQEDKQSYGTTTALAGGTAAAGGAAVAAEDTQTPTGLQTEPQQTGQSYGISTLPAETTQRSATSDIAPQEDKQSYGTTALAGSTAAAGGAAVAAEDGQNQPDDGSYWEEAKKKGFLFGRGDTRPSADTETSTSTTTAIPQEIGQTSQASAPVDTTGQTSTAPMIPEGSTDDSNFGRDAAIAGVGTAGVAGAGVAAYEGMHQDDTTTTPGAAAAEDKPDRAGLETNPAEDKQKESKGILGRIFGSKSEKKSESPASTATAVPDKTDAGETSRTVPAATGPTSTGPTSTEAPTVGSSIDDSNLGRDAAIAGLGTAGVAGAGAAVYEGMHQDDAGDEGIHREDKGDDVSGATYTARSYHLSSGTPSAPHEPTVEPDTNAPATQEPTRTHDTSLAGAGTLLGGGVATESVLAAEGDHPKDEEVENATYTDRAYPVGTSTETPSGQGGFSTLQDRVVSPHVPGEFPSESGEDPHTTGQWVPAGSTSQEADRGIGSGAAAAGVGGLGATAGVAGYEASKSSNEQPTTAESSMHPGGDDFPIMTTTNSVSHADPIEQPTQEEHHYGRDAAIAGGAVAATGAAGTGVYEATKDDPSIHTGNEHPPRTDPVQSQLGGEKEDEHHYGRDTAIAGGAVATTGTAGAGTYEATKEDPTDQSRNIEPAKSEPAPTTTPAPATTSSAPEEKEDEHHYGRDAAIAGGAGATGLAGYAGYEALKGDNDTGPASKTIGPHESNVANVMDPRVQPDPEKMRGEKETAGPYQSDMANKADPRVTSDQDKARQEEQKRVEKENKRIEDENNKREKEHKKAMEEENKKREKAEKEHKKAIEEENKRREKDEKKRADEQKKVSAAEESRRYDQEMEEKKRAEEEKRRGEDESNLGRDAAIAGGVGATGAAGYAGYEATKDHGDTSSSSDNRVSTDAEGHHHLHKKSAEEQGEKKPSLLQKILHPNKTRHEKEEAERAEWERAQQHHTHHAGHIGTDGPIGEDHAGSTGATDELAPTQSKPAAPMPEDGMITLVNEGADSDAHHIVVREHPSG